MPGSAPSRTPQAAETAAVPAASAKAATDPSNPEIEKLYDQSFGLYTGLRWAKAPGAKAYTAQSASEELTNEMAKFSAALKQAGDSIDAFKVTDTQKAPSLNQLYLIPQTLRNFIMIRLLLNPSIGKLDLYAEFKKYSVSVKKTPEIESAIRLIEGNQESTHPLKSLKHEDVKKTDGDFVVFSVLPFEVDGIFTAHQVVRAKNREDLLPLLKLMITKELLREYEVAAAYLDVKNPGKDLAFLDRSLKDLGIDLVSRFPVESNVSNLATELGYALAQDKALVPFDLSTDADLRAFVTKAFTKLSAEATKASAADAGEVIRGNQKAFFESVKDDQMSRKQEIAGNITLMKIPLATADKYQKISDDLATNAADQALATFQDLRSILAQSGTAQDSFSDAELKALLDKLHAKIQKGYSAYFMAWLNKGAVKNESNEMKRLVDNLVELAKSTTKIPSVAASPAFLLQTKYIEIANLAPRERTVQRWLKLLAAQQDFEEARVFHKIQLAQLKLETAPNVKLGVGSKIDPKINSKIHDITMTGRKKDLKDWESIGEIMGFGIPKGYPTLMEWIYFKSDSNFFASRKRTVLEDQVKRALVREALDMHPILSLTNAGADKDLLSVLVDPATEHDKLENVVRQHLERSKETLIKNLDEVLGYRLCSEIEDFILSSPTFGTLVDNEMPELAALFGSEKMERRLLSPAAFAQKNIVRKFNKYLGSAYLATIALSVLRFATMRFGSAQKILAPMLLTANSQLNAFTWAFMSLISVDAATTLAQYYRTKQDRKNLERFFSNSTYKNSLLSAADLELKRNEETRLKRTAIFTGSLNLFFIGMILKARLVQGRAVTVLEDLEKDQKALEILGLSHGQFDKEAIERALKAHLDVMGPGAGGSYQDAADLLLGRIKTNQTWRSDIFNFYEGEYKETLMNVPSYRSLNARERDIVNTVKLLWQTESLKPLIDQTAKFSIRGAR